MSELVLLKNIDNPDASRIETYEKSGGYQGLRTVLRDYDPDQVIETVKSSNLRGRGGAGFPTGLKWSFVPKDNPLPRYLCCNADEGEPGTFKDRILMERDPHQLIEGMVIAAYAIGCKTAYLYIRGEYSVSIEHCQQAIDEAHALGYLGQNILNSGHSLDIHIHKGAGAYICGEETALLESIEGKRGQPKLKPPFPAVAGLYECPTVVNNVETLACLPHLFRRGEDWFSSIGPKDAPGPKLFGLSGHVRKPGLYELPMGMSLGEMLEVYGGGALNGAFKAAIPGGVSAPMFPSDLFDVKMDFGSLAAAGSMLGSAAVIGLDDTASIPVVARRITEFFNHESCGKCTPCREGLTWAAKILRRIEAGQGQVGDVEQLAMLCGGIFGKSFCALGDGAAWALGATIKHFRHEFDALIAPQTMVS
ncbi:NADH-quinone oxidoreductase subunit NuoF [Parasedimentitalea huanghaiensis]|uniref:NADH-quinone oxidoreductase subunit F n=1 Tax=Parasedimentitalea huanghaiensis TaxID=2682100 RepID=A0A6L6WDM7_9RHOB|nr:NADH-quinone oxidoreductase subunit NuoF [Zongyanglinia huanghaiensis]MVO15610.1 NADH-quinone oxidoreductase subunit NuoF [Zongyanglinia huanghaiensis]